MRFYGIHFGHDSGVAVIDEDQSVRLYQAERYGPRCKHIENNVNPVFESFPNFPKPEKGDVICLVYCAQRPIMTSPDYKYDRFLVRESSKTQDEPEVVKALGFQPNLIIDHHFAHTLAAWCYRENDSEKTFIIYDGAGPTLEHGGFKSSICGWISKLGFGHYPEAYDIPSSIPLSQINNEEFSAGKIMGLAGYLPNATWHQDMIIPLLDPFNRELTPLRMEMAAAFYKMYTNIIWECVEKNIDKYPANGVVIGGGTTLALEINSRIHRKTGNVTFAPCTDDSGLALGAAAMSYYHATGYWPQINTPSLNETSKPLPAVGPQNPADIAKMISKGQVVCLLRGRAEAGPRALGYRSILAKATDGMLQKVSQEIKEREFYRPLAPSVTEEEFPKLFTGPQGRYMQYKVDCTDICKQQLPSIVHVDGSSRPQVVRKIDDPWFHELLSEFGRMSGHECLINTSLNKAGMPICDTYEDAVSDMEGKDVEIVSIRSDK